MKILCVGVHLHETDLRSAVLCSMGHDSVSALLDDVPDALNGERFDALVVSSDTPRLPLEGFLSSSANPRIKVLWLERGQAGSHLVAAVECLFPAKKKNVSVRSAHPVSRYA